MKYIVGRQQREIAFTLSDGVVIVTPKRTYTEFEFSRGKKALIELSDAQAKELSENPLFEEHIAKGTFVVRSKRPENVQVSASQLEAELIAERTKLEEVANRADEVIAARDAEIAKLRAELAARK